MTMRPAALVALALLAATLLPAGARATPLQLPATTRATLGNGLTVIVMPTHRLPLVDFRLVVRTGAIHDSPGKEGLASLTADLLYALLNPRIRVGAGA